MKKCGYLLLILLLAVMLTVGCTPGDPTEPPTDPQTVQTDPPTEPPADPTELSLPDAVAFYQELLTWGEERRYCQALGCVFESPEQALVYFFFYNGVGQSGSWGSLTAAEQDYLLEAGFINEMDLQIMPAQTLDDTLRQYFGVSLEDVEIPEEWVYSPDSDCYYTNHNDAWGSAAHVTEVRETAEGLIRVFCTVDCVFQSAEGSFDPDRGEYIFDADMVLTLRPMEDGRYQMISNVPVN